MLPPAQTNYDIVMQNSVTVITNLTYNQGQKDLRYLNVWSDRVACSNVAFHSGRNFIKEFFGSYLQLRDKPTFSEPDYYYEALSFFPDKSLILTAQSNNLTAGLNLETTVTQLSWIRADRLFCTEMSVLNGPISQVGTPDLSHQDENKFYVDNRLLSYNTPE
jgi:hypothetical protein